MTELIVVDSPYATELVDDDKTSVSKVRGKWEFVAQTEKQLSFPAGALITVDAQYGVANGWWHGSYDGKDGIFPINYTEVYEIEKVKYKKMSIRTSVVSNKIRMLQYQLGKYEEDKLALPQTPEEIEKDKNEERKEEIRKSRAVINFATGEVTEIKKNDIVMKEGEEGEEGEEEEEEEEEEEDYETESETEDEEMEGEEDEECLISEDEDEEEASGEEMEASGEEIENAVLPVIAVDTQKENMNEEMGEDNVVAPAYLGKEEKEISSISFSLTKEVTVHTKEEAIPLKMEENESPSYIASPEAPMAKEEELVSVPAYLATSDAKTEEIIILPTKEEETSSIPAYLGASDVKTEKEEKKEKEEESASVPAYLGASDVKTEEKEEKKEKEEESASVPAYLVASEVKTVSTEEKEEIVEEKIAVVEEKVTGVDISTFTFWEACYKGFLQRVKDLVHEGINIDEKNVDGITGLHAAAKSGHSDIILYLLERGASISVLDGLNQMPHTQSGCSAATRQILLKDLRSEPIWVPDISSPSCLICAKDFSFFNRKHHCRNCGILACKACTSYQYALPRIYKVTSKFRVCSYCHPVLSSPN